MFATAIIMPASTDSFGISCRWRGGEATGGHAGRLLLLAAPGVLVTPIVPVIGREADERLPAAAE
jgi:hypothetical protein